MSNKIYKIRRKSDGLFSCGGTYYPFFSKDGKIWTSIGGLKIHLANLDVYKACRIKVGTSNGGKKKLGFDLSKLPANHIYHNCEIVVCDLNYVHVSDVDVFLQNY
jgi:hypothetical protein